MREWGPLDFIGYIALGATALFLAINSWLALPAVRKNAPDELKNPQWGFLPIACFVIATLAFVARLLISGDSQSQIAAPSTTQNAPSAPSTDVESIRHLSYQLSQDIGDFYDSYFTRRQAIKNEVDAEKRATDTEALEKEMSDKFKEKFKFRYLSLIDEMKKRGVKFYDMIDFDQSIISTATIWTSATVISIGARSLK
jgi:hypothetical protein